MIDPNLKTILKFQTSTDIDDFLSMPLFKKCTISDSESLAQLVEPVLEGKLYDSKLVDKK